MKTNFILLLTGAMLFTSLAQAQSFTPIRVDTNQYKLWRKKPISVEHLSTCRVESALNETGDAILLQIGILGSTYDYFGWDMPIPLSDFPLVTGYHHEYRVPGMPHMNLDYNGKTLMLSLEKKSPVFTMIFPFSLEINSNLTTPKVFKGVVAGYEIGPFGNPVKQIAEECYF